MARFHTAFAHRACRTAAWRREPRGRHHEHGEHRARAGRLSAKGRRADREPARSSGGSLWRAAPSGDRLRASQRRDPHESAGNAPLHAMRNGAPACAASRSRIISTRPSLQRRPAGRGRPCRFRCKCDPRIATPTVPGRATLCPCVSPCGQNRCTLGCTLTPAEHRIASKVAFRGHPRHS